MAPSTDHINQFNPSLIGDGQCAAIQTLFVLLLNLSLSCWTFNTVILSAQRDSWDGQK